MPVQAAPAGTDCGLFFGFPGYGLMIIIYNIVEGARNGIIGN